ncbi:unnamed protein product [Lota lota]
MATSPDKIPCFFTGTRENDFYFQVANNEPGIKCQTLSYEISTRSSLNWLRVKDNLILFLVGEDQLRFVEDSSQQDRVNPACKFIVQLFNENPDTPPHPENRGRPVTLAAVVDNQYKVVSCGDKYDVKVETMDKLPEIINDDDCCTLFYMRSACYSSDHFLFQSAAHNTHVLGFNQVPGEGDSKWKLVLRPLMSDEVDEGCLIDVAPCQ